MTTKTITATHPAQRMPAVVSFVQAARQGSFVAAARMQGISSAAVSKNIASLESALGLRLMNRTTRSLQLTSEGSAFLAQVSVAMDALDGAMNNIARQRTQASGIVKISTSNAFGMAYLMPLLAGLRQQHPSLQVEVDFDDRQADLIKGGYDLALRGGAQEDSSLVVRKVCTLLTILVASPGYLQTHGVPRKPADLAQHQHIAVRFLNGRTSAWPFKTAHGDVQDFLPPAPVVTVSAPEAAVNAAALGLGVAQVAAHHAWTHLQAGRLKVLMQKQHQPALREMVLHYPHRALLAPRVKTTVDFLLTGLAQNEALHLTALEMAEFVA